VVIKDNLDYGGLVTTAGYWGFSTASGGVDMIPENDAVVVERVRRAGAIVLGKTNMSDFARDGTRTRSSVAGVTRNAHDVTRAPGGSSGGTATAVNASFAVLGLGTETGGSIENPAASQGLVGVKPTFGLVPLEGVVPFDASHRDVVGPIARTVSDAAVTLDAIAGPAGEDPEGYASERRIPSGGYAAALDATALRGRRFGLVGPGWRDQHLPLAPETEALYRRAIAVLEEGGGEVVEDPFRGTAWRELYATHGSVPSVDAGDLLRYMQELGAGAAFHSPEEWEALAGEALLTNGRRAGRGARPAPILPRPTGQADAFGAWRRDIRALFREVLASHDLDGLFFPQAGGPIRPLVEDPMRPDFSPNNHPELPSNIVNYVGLPVVTLPVGYYTDGMPFVVAFIGDLWTEAQLLGYAYDLEQATRSRAAPRLVTELAP